MTRLISLFIILFSLATKVAMSAPVTPEDMVKDIFDRAGKENLLLNQSSREIVDSHLDFKEMCKDILAGDKTQRSTEELQWFESTIKEIITHSVYPNAPKFLENVKYTLKPTEFSEDKAKIVSTINKKGESTQVDYFMKKVNDEWKIVDVAIDDESWIKTLNEKVQKTLVKKGWKGLKELLTKRLKELKNPNNDG